MKDLWWSENENKKYEK